MAMKRACDASLTYKGSTYVVRDNHFWQAMSSKYHLQGLDHTSVVADDVNLPFQVASIKRDNGY